MIQSLIKHGNSRALIIDMTILRAAGLDDHALFQVTLDPNGGITIQSVKVEEAGSCEKALQEVLKENDTLIRRLANR